MSNETDKNAARVLILSALVAFLRIAYDAAITHGIDFRKLPEAAEEAEARKRLAMVGWQRGAEVMVQYYETLGNAVRAAVRRKGLRPINGGRHVPPK